MKNPTGKTAEKTRKQKPLAYEGVVQDRILGYSVNQLAQRHKLDRQTVSKIITDNQERIQAAIQELLKLRQADIDDFIEAETQDILTLCRQSTIMLKLALNQMQESSDGFLTTEVRKKEDNQWVKRIPALHIDQVLYVWKEVHVVFQQMQKNATDVAGQSPEQS